MLAQVSGLSSGPRFVPCIMATLLDFLKSFGEFVPPTDIVDAANTFLTSGEVCLLAPGNLAGIAIQDLAAMDGFPKPIVQRFLGAGYYYGKRCFRSSFKSFRWLVVRAYE